MEWDLSVLFESLDDPRIKQTIETAKSRAAQIEQEFKGKINSPEMTADKLIKLINSVEKLYQDNTVEQYARLTVSADLSNKNALALLNFVSSEMTEIEKQLSFVKLEIGKLIKVRGIELLDELDFRANSG